MKKNKRGFSILTVTVFIVLLTAFGAFMVSILATGSSSSMYELLSSKALFIAESGLEMGIRWLKEHDQFGQNMNMPDTATFLAQGIDTAFALGSYTIESSYCLTALSANINASATSMDVFSTEDFPATGRILVTKENIQDFDFTDTTKYEEMTYTGRTTSAPLRFTGLTRGYNSTTSAEHNTGDRVYPVTVLTAGISATTQTISVGNTAKFINSGSIRIIDHANGNESIDYSVRTNDSFQFCIRTTGLSHNAGCIVIPGSDQCELLVTASTATANSARRRVRITAR